MPIQIRPLCVSERTNAVFRDVRSRNVIEEIMFLHFPEVFSPNVPQPPVIDLTWGKGAFWGDNSSAVLGLDIAPRLGCAVKADCRHVPVKDGAFVVAVFDPPHLFSRGKVYGTRLDADYGQLRNWDEVLALYIGAAPELRRVAQRGAIIKFTDMVKHGRFWATHMIVGAKLVPFLGWPEDVAILDSGIVRPQPPGRPVRHLRHAHSYFLCYKWV